MVCLMKLSKEKWGSLGKYIFAMKLINPEESENRTKMTEHKQQTCLKTENCCKRSLYTYTFNIIEIFLSSVFIQ